MKKKIRKRVFMYTQDLDHLPFKAEDLESNLKKLGLKSWAYILHNKDKDKNQKPVRPHYHAILQYKDAKTISAVAKMIGDKQQYIEAWKGSVNNAYSYLIHRTAAAKEKYQYDPKEVVASFDYVAKIKEITEEVTQKERNSSKFIQARLQEYADRVIDYDQLTQEIGTLAVAKQQQVIDRITQLHDQEDHKNWVEWAKKTNLKVKVLWLYGEAGVGKTRMAEMILRKENFITLGSSRDYFQEYHGEHFIILNDLRPGDFDYSDLLRLLDPYQYEKAAPSRYHDKQLSAQEIIITTPYDPVTFYENMKIADPFIDTADQLLRRIVPIKVTPKLFKEVTIKVLARKMAQS